MELKPIFYHDFSCKADRCAHTCCKGWEIDIDEETAVRYFAMQDDFGSRLQSVIDVTDGTYSFHLDEEDRCPMLLENGLCDLILHCTEEALCDICAEHPRFYGRIESIDYMGVGLSCEEAVFLLLSQEGDLLLEADGMPISFPELMRSLGYASEELLFQPVMDPTEWEEIFALYRLCEPIDATWQMQLEEIYTSIDRMQGLLAQKRSDDFSVYQRIYQYIFYRQLERIVDCGFERLKVYAQQATMFVYLWDLLEMDTREHLRRWSEQMEYSEDNTEILLGL